MAILNGLAWHFDQLLLLLVCVNRRLVAADTNQKQIE